MGVKTVRGVLERSEPVGTDRLVLIVLAEHADDVTGECYPGVELIAAESAIKPRTVQYALQRLAMAGDIEIEPHGAPITSRPWQYRPNLYRVPSGAQRCISNSAPVVHSGASPVVHVDVASGAPGRLPVVHGGAPKPSKNHQEPSRPHKATARALAVIAFEQTPKPVTRGGFPAVLKMIETTLEGGHSVEDIEAAIHAGIGTWSLNGITFALNRLPRSSGDSYDAPEPRYG